MDNLSVLVETRPGIDPASPRAIAAAKQLQHDVKTFVGTSIAVELKPEGGVERSLGKAKRVVDLRK
jgi:phenylacetate-CoA ligase